MCHLNYGRKFLKCLLYIMNMSSELCKSSKNGDNRCTLRSMPANYTKHNVVTTLKIEHS